MNIQELKNYKKIQKSYLINFLLLINNNEQIKDKTGIYKGKIILLIKRWKNLFFNAFFTKFRLLTELLTKQLINFNVGVS